MKPNAHCENEPRNRARRTHLIAVELERPAEEQPRSKKKWDLAANMEALIGGARMRTVRGHQSRTSTLTANPIQMNGRRRGGLPLAPEDVDCCSRRCTGLMGSRGGDRFFHRGS